MTETLLGLVLARLALVEAPVILHHEAKAFPAAELKELVKAGILRETSRATEIPCPARLGAGGDLIVRDTAKGLFGVADEDDYCEPVRLTEDDVRQYEVVARRLAQQIRSANGLRGSLKEEGQRLIALGEKRLPGGLKASVCLTLAGADEAETLAVAEHLRPVQPRPLALLMPVAVPLSVAAKQALAASETYIIPLADYLEPAGWIIPWAEILIPTVDRGKLTAANAFCFAVTHEGRQYLDGEGYQRLVGSADDYAVFGDELSHEGRKKQGKKIAQKTGIPASYFRILRAVVESRTYFDPVRDDPQQERFSGRQTFQRARKVVDVSYKDPRGRTCWHLFKTSKPGNRAVYRFDPDGGFPFALIFLPRA